MDEIDISSRLFISDIASRQKSFRRRRGNGNKMSSMATLVSDSTILNHHDEDSSPYRSVSVDKLRYKSISNENLLQYAEAHRLYIRSTAASSSRQSFWKDRLQRLAINVTSGIIAFLLSSTIAVTCASVVVGHGTILSSYVSHFISMNFLGTAVLCTLLATRSSAPYVLGAIDVFVAPIIGEMAQAISVHLNHNMKAVLPTIVVLISGSAVLLGLTFTLMGSLKVTRVANYMPFPVVAGFLAGVGGTLVQNGVRMAVGSTSFITELLSNPFEATLHLLPAITFALVTRWMTYKRYSVAISFPILLITSVIGFHALTMNVSLSDLKKDRWLFAWSDSVMEETPLWYSWSHINFYHIHWHAIFFESRSYVFTLLFLGALKYSVFTTSMSMVFDREISPDVEMKAIGSANVISGILGCNGGCHYLSAMGMLRSLNSDEKTPAYICSAFFLIVWLTGFKLLVYIPKFVFGGLLLNIGIHFLEAYLISPAYVISRLETATLCLILIGFLFEGMLQSVFLGILISAMTLVYRIYTVGCVVEVAAAVTSRSSVDRSVSENEYLDTYGDDAIHLLKLHGFIFFGTSVSILDIVKKRVTSLDKRRLEFLIIDFALVPDFDATALNNFKRLTSLAERFLYRIVYCNASTKVEKALARNPKSAFVSFCNVLDDALEACENSILPPELAYSTSHGLHVVELWEQYLFQQEGSSSQQERLHALVLHMDRIDLKIGESLFTAEDRRRQRSDTYFICAGSVSIYENDDDIVSKSRSRKAGSGSVIAEDFRSRCYVIADSAVVVLLRLNKTVKHELMKVSPMLSLELMVLLNAKLAQRLDQMERRKHH